MQSTTLQLDISLSGDTLRILPREWSEQHRTASSMEYQEEQIFRRDLVDRICCKIGELLNRDALRERGHSGYLDELRSAGNVLYTELLGTELRRTLHSTSADTLRLSLSGELLYIPWELLHDGEEFLSARFHIGRVVKVQHGLPAIPQHERTPPFRMLLLYDPAVDPDRSIRERIMAVQRECNQFNELLSVDIEMLRMEYASLLHAFAQYDLFHCRSHMVADGVESGWVLQDGQTFGVRELNRMTESRIAMPVLTFSDGCESAKTGVMAIEHLVLAFLRSGVQHYIGTLCKIPPASSAYFTLAFYRALLDGMSVGAAISQARKSLIANDGPQRLLWAGYVLYGDPTTRVFSFETLLSRQGNDPRKLLAQGIQFQQQGKWMQAMACYQQAKQQAKKQRADDQHTVLSDISFHIGTLLHKQGKYSQAQRYLDNTLKLSKVRSPSVLNALALVYWKQGDWQEAQHLCQESLDQAASDDDLFQCAKAYHSLGLVYRASGKLHQSFDAFDQAIALYTRFNQEDELVKVYDSYGVTHYRIGDLDKALFWFEKNKTTKQKMEDRYGYAITPTTTLTF